jgi:hypothetical protein
MQSVRIAAFLASHFPAGKKQPRSGCKVKRPGLSCPSRFPRIEREREREREKVIMHPAAFPKERDTGLGIDGRYHREHVRNCRADSQIAAR